MQRFLKSVVLAVLAVGVIFAPCRIAFAQSKLIKIGKSDKLFSLALKSGKSVDCLKQGKKKAFPGAAKKSGKMFLPMSVSFADQSAKITAQLSLPSLPPKKLKKLKAQLKALKAEFKEATKSCASNGGNPLPCNVVVSDREFSTSENTAVQFILTAPETCNETPTIRISSNVSFGLVSGGENGNYQFDPGLKTGEATLRYQGCRPSTSECGTEATVKFKVGANSAGFIGRVDSLEPYRDTLTFEEAQHLIRKVALNDHWFLDSFVKNKTSIKREDLINALMDPDYVAPDLKSHLERMRDGVDYNGSKYPSYNLYSQRTFASTQDFTSTEAQREGLETYLGFAAKGYDTGADWLSYGGESTSPMVTARARFLSPMWEQMTHLWYGHFGTVIFNLGYGREWYTRDYMDMLHNNALGSFRRIVLGTTDNACVTGLGVGGGLICDGGTTFGLSNQFNTKTNQNQNLARELMELHLLGPKDPYTQQANYTEEDVRAATGFMSGFKEEDYASVDRTGVNQNQAVTRQRIVYDAARHDNSWFPAFTGTAYQFYGNMNPSQFVTHLFNNHPALPKFIAGKVFRMLVYRDPSESMVEELATRFKESNFDIAKLVATIASSQAMYSAKAIERQCVLEPFKVMTSTMRNFQLPEFGMNAQVWSAAPADRIHQMYNNMNYQQTRRVMLDEAGESILLYPTVFTHDYCGRNPQQYGEGWLFAGRMANRIIGMVNLLGHASNFNWLWYTFGDVKNLILNPGESATSLSPARTMAFFNKVYGVTPSASEEAVILRYLLTTLDGQGAEQPAFWDPTDFEYMNEKMTGLIAIYSSLSQANVN